MACAICNSRPSRRSCPGVEDHICSICCGTEREVTVDCPLDCPYLVEAHQREKKPTANPDEFPHPDIRVDESFLRRNEALLVLTAATLAQTAIAERLIDNDLKEALESLLRTYRTLQSGLIYDHRPDNPLAARAYTAVQDRIADIGRRLEEGNGALSESDILGILAFLQRLEIQHNNGRARGRAFIDFLRGFFPPEPETSESQIIL